MTKINKITESDGTKKQDGKKWKGRYAYEKAILYIYPRIAWLEAREREWIFNNAVLSYRQTFDPEGLVYKLLTAEGRCDELHALGGRLDEMFSRYSSFNIAVLMYYYAELAAPMRAYLKEHTVSNTTVRRHRKRALEQFSLEMNARGMNLDWFRENILCFEWAADVFDKILSGENDRRQKRWRRHGGLENSFGKNEEEV
jgi:hypothetical protein